MDNPLGRWPWRRVRVAGPSMSPTLSDADVVLVRRTTTAEPGDVVLVVWPGRLSVKRAVREVDGGWFVRGDNSFGSTDSRALGAATVVGVVTWRLWPRPGRVGRVGRARRSDQGGGA